MTDYFSARSHDAVEDDEEVPEHNFSGPNYIDGRCKYVFTRDSNYYCNNVIPPGKQFCRHCLRKFTVRVVTRTRTRLDDTTVRE